MGETPADKQIVLDLGVEGGGATIFRTTLASGRWEFHVEGSSMDMDENDDEVWRSWESPPYISIEEAIQSISKGGDWVLFYPRFVHPDYRTAVWELVQKTVQRRRLYDKKTWTDVRREWWRKLCHPEL